MIAKIKNLVYLGGLSLLSLPQNSHSAIVINEFQASNSSTLLDVGSLKYPDWIEIKNTGTSSLDLTGYSLSDNKDDLDKWSFPIGTTLAAGAYKIIFASGRDTLYSTQSIHTNFKLSSSGETLFLSNSKTEVLDSISFGTQITDQSMGRYANKWEIFSTATPLLDNVFQAKLDLPNFSHNSGMLSSSISLSINHPDASVKIYYTTDGSKPSTASSLYTHAISVNTSTSVKAIAYQAGKPISHVALATYLIGANHSLDIVSLTTSEDTLGGPTRVDFIEKSGKVGFSQIGSFRRSGKTSLGTPQINGKFSADLSYGPAKIDYQVFPNKPMKSVRGFLLRNSSQDFEYTHMRDAYFSRIISEGAITSMPFEDFRPAVVYVNGEYNGMINIREDDDKTYVRDNFGLDGSIEKVYPETPSYQGFDLSSASGRAQLESFVNISEWFFYYQALSFTGTGEWGGRLWKVEDSSDPFRLHLHDFDPSFDYYKGGAPLSALTGVGTAYSNEYYKGLMLQSYAAGLNHLYKAQRLKQILDTLVAELEPEADRHFKWAYSQAVSQSWTGSLGDLPPQNKAEWLSNVSVIENFIKTRTDSVWQAIETDHGLTPVNIISEVNSESMGRIRFFDVKAASYPDTSKFFEEFALKITAIPNPGFKFSHWSGDVSGSELSKNLTVSSGMNIKAHFFEDTLVSVTEDHDSKSALNFKTLIDVNQVSFPKENSWSIFNSNGLQISSGVSKTLNLPKLNPGVYFIKTSAQVIKLWKTH